MNSNVCVCMYIIDEHVGDEICLRCGSIRQLFSIPLNLEPVLISSDFIRTVCANNHIVKCIEDDALLKFSKQNKKTNSYAAYCIYYACKRHNAPRTLFEISTMCFVSQSDILKHDIDSQKVIKPSDLVARVCYRLDIDSFAFSREAGRVSDELFKNLLVNSPPQSVLAVGIYVLCSICKHSKSTKKSQSEIARACHVSTSCIRRLYRVYKEEILTLVTLILCKPYKA